MPKPSKTTSASDLPEHGPNTVELALVKLFNDLDQGRRTRLVATLKPFAAVFAEAGFTAGGGVRAKSLDRYADETAVYSVEAPKGKLQRAAHMAHVLKQANETPPMFADRYSRGPSIPTVQYIGLYTKADDRLAVKIGRSLLREGVFVRLDALEPLQRMRDRQPAQSNFFEATIPTMGERRVASSIPSCQRQGAATSDIVSIVGTFLTAANSPAAGLYNDAIKTLADRAKAAAEAKQASLQAQADEERRRLYGSSVIARYSLRW